MRDSSPTLTQLTAAFTHRRRNQITAMVHKKNLYLPGKQQPKVDLLTTTSTLSISSLTLSRPGPEGLPTQRTIPAMARYTNPWTFSQEKKNKKLRSLTATSTLLTSFHLFPRPRTTRTRNSTHLTQKILATWRRERREGNSQKNNKLRARLDFITNPAVASGVTLFFFYYSS